MKKEDFEEKTRILMDESLGAAVRIIPDMRKEISSYARFLESYQGEERQKKLEHEERISDTLRDLDDMLYKGYRAADDLIKVLKCVFR